MCLGLYGYVVMLSTYTFVLFTVCKHVSTVLEATKSCTRKMMNDDICLKRVLEVVCYGVHVKKNILNFMLHWKRVNQRQLFGSEISGVKEIKNYKFVDDISYCFTCRLNFSIYHFSKINFRHPIMPKIIMLLNEK